MMIRLWCALVLWAGMAHAQIVVDPQRSELRDVRGGTELVLSLDAITPYRVFTLDAPRRVVVDVAGLQVDRAVMQSLDQSDVVTDVRVAALRPGWTRLILALHSAHVVAEAGMRAQEAGAQLTLRLEPATPEDFAARSGPPVDPDWDTTGAFDPGVIAETDFVVVLDPAHGGADGGITYGGIREADLTLILAQELALRLNGLAGVRAVMTRQGNVVAASHRRIARARAVRADLVITFEGGQGPENGLRVLTLADGSAPTAQSPVSTVLGDLARGETMPAAARIADAFVAGFALRDIPLPREPRGTSMFPMLQVADVPVVAVVLGDLTSAEDRAFLSAPAGRNLVSAAIAETVVLLAR